MKKTILLTLLIASFTGAQAAVSISGTALQNPVAISGLDNPAGGDTAGLLMQLTSAHGAHLLLPSLAMS